MKNKIILLVEDNPDDEALALRAFKKANTANDIKVARDGQEAIDFLFDETQDLPQVVLLDLKLPKLDGLQVLEKIRENQRTKLLPVVILTTSKEQTDLIQGYNLGVNSYVQKPVDFNQFIEAVRNLGMYWLVLNEVPPSILGAI